MVTPWTLGEADILTGNGWDPHHAVRRRRALTSTVLCKHMAKSDAFLKSGGGGTEVAKRATYRSSREYHSHLNGRENERSTNRRENETRESNMNVSKGYELERCGTDDASTKNK